MDLVQEGDEGEEDAVEMPLDMMFDYPPEGNPAYPYCFYDSHCFANEFCRFSEGTCYAPGFCTDRGSGDCPTIYAPLCGCDHVTYGNECELASSGMSLMHAGECSSVICTQGDPEGFCAEGEFCEGPPGLCDVDGTPGWCENIPLECPEIQDYVCGCDHDMHDNDCTRKQAGVWHAHFGMYGYCWGP